MNFGAIPVQRGCGERERDGLYWELGTGDGGRPLADFLIDPPLPVPPELPLSAIGVQAIVAPNGVVHLADRVGICHYPNVADFIEEAARFGASRRLPKSLFKMTVKVDGVTRPVIECLTPESRLLLAHDRAIIWNWHEAFLKWGCPKCLPEHDVGAILDGEFQSIFNSTPDAPHCLGRCWYDLPVDTAANGGGLWHYGDDDANEPAPLIRNYVGGGQLVDPSDPRLTLRVMPSFSYYGVTRPDDFEPQHGRAFFASLPCSRLVVIRGEQSAAIAADAGRSGLPVTEVNE